MAVPRAGRRAHDGRVGAAIAVNDGAHGGRRDERNVDQRHQRGGDARPIDDAEAGDERRELTAVVLAIDDEARRQSARRERPDDVVSVVAHDDHDVVDAGVQKRADDARQEGVVAAERQRRFRAPHARGTASGQDEGRDHEDRPPERLALQVIKGSRHIVMKAGVESRP